ncbi:hypothetical protein [Pseudoalteromonas galatheae]|uniref:portal protein n=2 Tax=Pseudoalteromonas galatheae TaxID=579562 RepID=UPI0030D58398
MMKFSQPARFIEDLVSDIKSQPSQWRQESATCELYYDGHQVKAADKELLDSRGQPLLIYNLIHPTVNGVLGMEAKTRTDWLVKSDDKEGMEVAEVLNERVNEVARLARAQRACSDAFARQCKAGIGWVEVRRNDDPFGDPYIVEEVDWAEVWFDWHAKRPDLKDARWVVREKWLDLDEAVLYMPQKESLLNTVYHDSWEPMDLATTSDDLSHTLVSAWHVQQETTLHSSDWMSADRKRVRMFEVWYRKPKSAPVIELNGNVMEYDSNNKIHVALRNNGHAKVYRAIFSEMRRAIYCGPHLLHEGASPYPHNEFPLVPFFGYREGRSRVPYGLIRNMISAQDGVNFRHSMLTWLLKARRVLMIEGATNMKDVELQEQLARVDGIIKLNPDVVREMGMDRVFKIDSELGVATEQYRLMEHAQTMIQDSAGVYNAVLGKSDSGATSGIAINSLVEQGSITLSELYDNYASARQQVGSLLAYLEAERLGSKPQTLSLYANSSKPTKTIEVNKPGEGGYITNKVTMLKKHVVMADIHTTAGYQQQMIDRLMQLMGSLPEQVQPLLLMKVIELSELPGKDELIKAMSQLLGVSVSKEDLTEEELQQLQQQEQVKQAQAQMQQLLEQEVLKERQLKNQETEVDLLLKRANTTLAEARVRQVDANTEHEQAKTVDTLSKVGERDQQMQEAEFAHKVQLEQQIDTLIGEMMSS